MSLTFFTYKSSSTHINTERAKERRKSKSLIVCRVNRKLTLSCLKMVWSSNMSSFLLILMILNSTLFSLMVNGRPEPNSVEFTPRGDKDEKMVIGSRPPSCERVRCRSCGHCEAIQVPTNHQTKLHSSTSVSEIINPDYTRGDDTTNYKPMSWKCKCGDYIYNP